MTGNVRILHFIPTLGAGGAERQLALLSRAQVETGHDVHVAFGEGGPNREDMHPGVLLHSFHNYGNHDPRLTWRAVQLIREVRPDVVQTWLTQMDVVAGIASLACRTPWILTERSTREAYPRSVKNRARERLGRLSSAIVANSEAGLEYWTALAPRSRVRRVISNGVAVSRIEAATERRAVADGPVVLYAGRLAEEKNVRGFVDSFALVAAATDAEAVICGDGPLRRDLEAYVRCLGLAASVTFVGYCRDVRTMMQSASVFVSLSKFEGNPNAVLEAAAEGGPLVLSDIDAHTSIFGPAEACLVKGLEDAATAIIGTLSDPSSARARAERAARKVQRWSIDRITAAWDALYDELLVGRTGRAR